MEYIEMAAAPKGMFDKIISNDGLRVPFASNGPGGTGFRPMPLPVFSHGKSLSSVAMAPAPPSGSGPELSRRGGMPSFATSGMSLTGSQIALVSSANGGLGVMHLQIPGESGSSMQGDDSMEKGKSRGEGGRGSRGGGTSSRKRTRGGFTTGEVIVLDGSLSGGAVLSAGRASAANGTRQRPNSNGEKAEKSTSKRQSGQVAKRGENKKQAVMVTAPVIDPILPKVAEANGVPNCWTNGILDIYGLRTRTMDVSRFMVDIPLNDLLSGNFEAPSFSLKENHEKKAEVEDDLVQQIDSVLHLLPKRGAAFKVHPSFEDMSGNWSVKSSKNQKMLLDLESPLHPEEEDIVSKVGKPEKETWSDLAPPIKLEADADKEVRMGSTAVLTDGLSKPGAPSRFALDGLSVYSVENFMSRLKLVPSDPLLSLGVSGADGEASGSADNRTSGDVVESCHRNGSVPPSFFSYPPVGPLKVENSRYNQRIWIRGPTTENSSRKSVSGSGGKESLKVPGEDAGANSPSSRQRKVDSKDKAVSPDAMEVRMFGTQSLASGQLGYSRPSNIAEPFVKEEPRQVENAIGLSSEGNPKPMEIDSYRVDTGSVAASGADGTESSFVLPSEHDWQRGNGEAVRPLDTPSTLAGPQEMETSDRQGKALVSTLSEVKQDKVEQQVKDPGEASRGPPQELLAPKQEMSLDLPSLDSKITIRRSSSPQNDDSPIDLPAMPSSPRIVSAARILCMMANSAYHPDQDKIEVETERRRRFQPYAGAPAQKTAKSIRVSNSVFVQGDEVKEGRRRADGGSVPSSKSLVSERRKSLSQVNDASEKPSYSSPRNSNGGGISSGSRGGPNAGSRASNLSVKLEKVAARESTKESTSIKEPVARGPSSLPPLSNGGLPSKNGHKGLKTNSYVHSSNPKGSAAAASFAKVPAACTAQRIVTGGTSSRSSRTVHTGNILASHSPAPVPFKSSRQSIPESRPKTKTELSARGGKPIRE